MAAGDTGLEEDLRALGDADSRRQEQAVRRIRGMGSTAVPRLLEELAADRLGGVGQARILRLLAQSGAPETLPPILAVMDDPRHVVREAAIEAVAEFDDPRASAVLVRLLGDADTDVVKQAASRLGERRDAGAVEALGKLLERNEQGVRYSAARALANIAEPQAHQVLVAHLPQEADEEVRAVIEQARRKGSF